MFNDKDFMGGMFDFDGNGKTTLDEQYKPTERHTSDIIAVNSFSHFILRFLEHLNKV